MVDVVNPSLRIFGATSYAVLSAASVVLNAVLVYILVKVGQRRL